MIFLYILVAEIEAMEEDNDEYISALGGCRKAENTPRANRKYTHGVIAWNTATGYVLYIRPILYRETTTFIIISFNNLFLYGKIFEEYFNRIHAVGFDVMCGIFLRLINLISLNLLEPNIIHAWSLIILRLFVDKFHINKHVRILCTLNEQSGMFHPNLYKFTGILNNCKTRNEQVMLHNIFYHCQLYIICNINIFRLANNCGVKD